MEEEPFGNPWIFKEILTGETLNISKEEKLETILKHINLAVELKGENIGIKEMRKQICWYTKNLPNSAEMRNEVNRLETKKEVQKLLMEYFNEINI